MDTIISKRLAPWVARIGLLALLLSLGLFASPARPAAAQGATVDVAARGSSLEFHASSPFTVTWDIWLSATSVQTSPFPPHFPTGGTLKPRVKHFAAPAQTSFAPAFTELAPDTTYNYIVRAGGSYMTGSKKTLKRQVTVLFDKIDVIDDSDYLSAGDLMFYFNVNGQWFADFGQVSGSSGESVFPKRSLVIVPGPSTLTMAVNGQDEDCDFCTYGIGPRAGNGSDSNMDWATAQNGAISVAKIGPSNENFVSKSITFETGSAPLEFKVYATIQVRYS